MTDLSPAAQALHDAFMTAPLCAEVKLAAALRALAEQVVPLLVVMADLDKLL